MNRDKTIDTASKAINGDRAADYGSARDNFTRIGKHWELVLGVPVNAEKVAICMTLVKIARLYNTPTHEDSWVDGVGYLALGAEIATEDATLADECLRCHHIIDEHHSAAGIINPCHWSGCDCDDLDLTGWSRK